MSHGGIILHILGNSVVVGLINICTCAVVDIAREILYCTLIFTWLFVYVCICLYFLSWHVFCSFFVFFSNVLVSLQWITTTAVMNLDCLCRPFFWSFCREPRKKVNILKVVTRTLHHRHLSKFKFCFCFLPQLEATQMITQMTMNKIWIRTTFEMFTARFLYFLCFCLYLLLLCMFKFASD